MHTPARGDLRAVRYREQLPVGGEPCEPLRCVSVRTDDTRPVVKSFKEANFAHMEPAWIQRYT